MDTTGLPPIEPAGARVLILGSLPGAESVRLQQYYGHRQNLFWKLMPLVLSEPAVDDYAARVEMLKRHHVALQRVGGFAMVAVGVLLVTGWWDALMGIFRQWASAFGVVI